EQLVPEHLRTDERLLAVRLAPGLPAEEDPDHEEPAYRQPDRRRQTGPGRPVGLGLDPAPLARAEDAEDEQAKTEGREDGADKVEMRTGLGRRVGDPAGEDQNQGHQHHYPHQ